MTPRDLSRSEAERVVRNREAAFLCAWCGVPLPQDSALNRITCTRAHNKALSRWRLGQHLAPRVRPCASCGTVIDRNAVRGRMPRLCDSCRQQER